MPRRRKPHITLWEIWSKSGYGGPRPTWHCTAAFNTEDGAREYVRKNAGAGYVSGTLAIRKRRVLAATARI